MGRATPVIAEAASSAPPCLISCRLPAGLFLYVGDTDYSAFSGK
jgi:hypothetical protein